MDLLMPDLKKRILITGAAGFIGFHLTGRLLNMGYTVMGFDNLNDYYDVSLKKSRLKVLKNNKSFIFQKGDIKNQKVLTHVFSSFRPDVVIHLAAQAGVRYSIENPKLYIDSNITGFFNMLESCRHFPVEHLLFASSSSVYGNQVKLPFSVDDEVNYQVSLYASTKKTNELMAYTYSHLYGIPITGLRFFTVYGPYGRPDMAYFGFTDKIFKGDPIQVYNNGDMYRDYTYIDDVTLGMIPMLSDVPVAGQGRAEKGAPYRIYNIGNNRPEKLLLLIETLEQIIGKKAKKEYLPMQPGDVYMTYADITETIEDFNFCPTTNIDKGLEQFVKWYRNYYK